MSLAPSLARDIGAHALLTAEEERDLARRRDAGDGGARDELVRRNARLAFGIARPYRLRLPAHRDDIASAAFLGLINAADRFRPDTAARFATYATIAIRHAIRDYLADEMPTIRVARTALVCAEHLARGVEPPAWAAHQSYLAPDAFRALGCGHSDRLDYLWASPPGFDADADRVRDAVARLRPVDAEILRLRFGLDGSGERTLAECSAILDVTREGARRRSEAAIRAIRPMLARDEREAQP